MKAETGCDGVMIGRGAMGNPWFFRTLRALEEGRPDPGPPTLEERWTIWRRHAALVGTYAVERMQVHELRKTLAWYSRGLRGGAELRQRSCGEKNAQAMLEMGEAFFERLAHLGEAVTTAPADPVAKAIARQERRGGGHQEAPEAAQADECAA
jgi:tRNA-dihydrouridine synthase